MRRRGEVPSARLADATKRAQAPRPEEAPRGQRSRDTAELRSSEARAGAQMRGDLRPVSARPAARQPDPAAESRPTRELPPAEEADPRPDPRRALQVVKRAVGSAYGSDPTLTRAVNELSDFVNKTAPTSESEDVPDEQPKSEDKPAFEQQPENEAPTHQELEQHREPQGQQAQDADVGRSVLKVAPRFAFQRLMTSVAAMQPRIRPPGVALNLQG